jgi:hypothetical protein
MSLRKTFLSAIKNQEEVERKNLEDIVMRMTDPQIKLALICIIKGADVDYAIRVSAGERIVKSYLEEAIRKYEADSRA